MSSFEELRVCDSTNKVVLERQTPEAFSMVLSLHQTNGIGRHGRRWMAQRDDALAFSFFLSSSAGQRQKLLDDGPSWVPLIAGAAVIEALTLVTSSHFSLKWPNDVMHRGKKISGILTQVHPDGGYVVGVGLNLRFSGEPPSPTATSLEGLAETNPDFLDRFTSSFVLRLVDMLELSRRECRQLVHPFLVTLGQRVTISETRKPPWEGFAEDIGERGELIVSDQQGTRIHLDAADVWHLRPINGG